MNRFDLKAFDFKFFQKHPSFHPKENLTAESGEVCKM